VIWPELEAKNFFVRDWTARNCLKKSFLRARDFARFDGFQGQCQTKECSQIRHRRGGVTRHRSPLSARKQRDHLLPLFDRQRASLNARAPSLMDGIVR